MSKLDDAWGELFSAAASADAAGQDNALIDIEKEAFRAAYYACANGMGFMDFEFMDRGGMSDSQKDKMEKAKIKQLKQSFAMAQGIAAYISSLCMQSPSVTVTKDGESATLTNASAILLPRQSKMKDIIDDRKQIMINAILTTDAFELTEFGNQSYITDD